MRNKILLAIGGILLLLVIFLTTDEKKDFLTEETYWKKSIQSIIYNPPSRDWKGEEGSEFIPSKLELNLMDKGGLKKSPLFSVTSLPEEKSDSEKNSGEGKKIIYEAGYNAKNLFSELSVFKIKSVTEAKPSYMEEFAIDKERSPNLEILESGQSTVLWLGKEVKDKSLYSLSDGKFLLSANAHTFRRFRSQLDSFRERNLVTAGSGYLSKIQCTINGKVVEIENNPEKTKSGGIQNKWRRNSGTRLVIDPSLGDNLDTQLKSLRYEKYPDEDEDGLPVIRELVKLPVEMEWKILTSEGRKYKILLFPKTSIGDKEYRPTIRVIDDKLEETPAYTGENVYSRLLESIDSIRKAENWQRPEKKLK